MASVATASVGRTAAPQQNSGVAGAASLATSRGSAMLSSVAQPLPEAGDMPLFSRMDLEENR